MTSLKRTLKSRHISLIALGGMIGSSYFLGTGYILGEIGPCAFLAYILGGVITFLTMSCLAELSTADPLEGSFVSYSVKYISPSWGCGVGWSYWISWLVYIPSECLAAGILMNNFWPEISIGHWTIFFGGLITVINFLHVKVFGELEFWLATIKLFLIVGFSILALLIFLGLLPDHSTSFLGTKYLLKQGGLFPKGFFIVLINMVVLIANFQGSEIIGLAASESHEPLKYIPKILNSVCYRIIGTYLVPVLLLALIFPWNTARLSQSVFSDALAGYGLTSCAKIFSLLIVAGAVSCANSGLYASIRSLYGLATHRMAPEFLTSVNSGGTPLWATALTCLGIWAMLFSTYLFPSSSLYANLLAISGFTGSICWISICWAQFKLRKHRRTHNLPLPHIYKVKLFPYLTLLAVWLQVICLAVILFSKELRISFYLGVPALLIPMIIYKYTKHRRPIL